MPASQCGPVANPDGARPQGLIHHYEAIARESRSMLEAAHRGDWHEVDRIEQRCREMIAGLRQASRADALGDGENVRRMALLRAILQDDAQIRRRAEPWLRELEALLAAPAPAGSGVI